MDKKILRNDIILISSLLAVTVGTLIPIMLLQKKDNLTAHVYVQNDLVESIDLSKKEDKYYYVMGTNSRVTIHTKDGAIVYTGNFVFDSSMLGPYKTDIGTLAYVGKKGVLCLMSESI